MPLTNLGRRSRRSVLRAAATGSAGLAAALVLGCHARGGASSGAAPKTASGGAPVRGGTLRLTVAGDPGNLDVHQATDSQAMHLLMPLYSQVIRQVPNDWSKLGPDLATKWEASPDGTKWTFTIRQDVKWHDGQPLTVDDIAYSLNRMINPPSGFKGGGTGAIKAVATAARQVDAETLEIQLKSPAVSFLQTLAGAAVRILPKHIIEPIDQNEKSRSLKPAELIGSGPFRFKSYERGSTWVVDRNPNYYVPGQPYLDGMSYFIIPDANTRLESLIAGRLDMEGPDENIPQSQAKQLQSQAGDKYSVQKTVNARFVGAFFNTVAGPFQDQRLRRAVHLALARQPMIQLIQEGDGAVTPPLTSFDFVYPLDHYLQLPGYRADKTADLAQAKQLVDAATGGAGVDVPFLSINTSGYPDYLQLEKQQLDPIGIRGTIQTLESAVAEARYAAGQFQFVGVHPCAVPFNDPDSMITRYFLPTGDRNWPKWRNSGFEDLYSKESVTQDQTQRAKLLQQMADILDQELPTTGLTDSLRLTPLSKKIHGFDTLPPSVNADYRLDWIWLG